MASRQQTSPAPLHPAAVSAGDRPAAAVRWTARRARVAVAVAFGAASVIRDLVLLRLHGYSVQPDSGSYLQGNLLRSRPYPVMAWLTDASAHPILLIFLQILLAGLSVAVFVWVVFGASRVIAFGVGALFTVDVNWATMNLTLLSEGPFMTFSVLSLAVLGLQFEARHRLRPIGLAGAGVLFAWTCTIRPSNLYLLLPIALAYLAFTRSVSKTAWLASGMAGLLFASAWLTLIQTGYFRISGGTGYYVAFPLFSYQIFDRSNGPASAQIDTALRSCDPNIDYSKVHVLTSNQYLWGEYFPCLQQHGWSDDRIDHTFTSAYLEAVPAHPQRWFANWSGWFAIEMGYSINEVEAIYGRARCHCTSSGVDRPLYAEMDTLTLPVPYELAVVAAWLAILTLALLFVAGTLRVVALGAIVVIAYVSATVPAGHVFLPRYVEVLTPMQSVVLSMLAVMAIGGVLRLLQPRLRATQSTD